MTDAKEEFDVAVERRFIISAPHFVAMVIGDFKIHTAAPIVQYMMGWSIERVLDYCVKKRWNVKAV